MECGPQRLEEYLASVTPGPELAVALGAIDPAELCGHDAVSFLHAQYRQVAHEQGRLLLAVSHVARCGFDEGQHAQRMSSPDRWSPFEVKAVLGLTRCAAEGLVGLAWDVVDRAPEVGEAMLAGELDLRRAELLLEVTRGLAGSVQATVLANCIPLAALSGPRWTTGRLLSRPTDPPQPARTRPRRRKAPMGPTARTRRRPRPHRSRLAGIHRLGNRRTPTFLTASVVDACVAPPVHAS